MVASKKNESSTKETAVKTTATTANIISNNLETGLYVSKDYILNGVIKYGFEFIKEKNVYKKGNIYINAETRLVYSLDKNYDLSIIIQMYDENILSIHSI